MLLGGAQIANRNAHGKMTMQFCMRQEETTRLVDVAHDAFIQGFQLLLVVYPLWMGAKAYRAEGRGSHAFKMGGVVYQVREKLRQPDVFVDARRQSILTEITQDHPQLERAEAAAQRGTVVHQVRYLVPGALGVAQVFRHQAEGSLH